MRRTSRKVRDRTLRKSRVRRSKSRRIRRKTRVKRSRTKRRVRNRNVKKISRKTRNRKTRNRTRKISRRRKIGGAQQVHVQIYRDATCNKWEKKEFAYEVFNEQDRIQDNYFTLFGWSETVQELVRKLGQQYVNNDTIWQALQTHSKVAELSYMKHAGAAEEKVNVNFDVGHYLEDTEAPVFVIKPLPLK